jgi:hypothetical protein
MDKENHQKRDQKLPPLAVAIDTDIFTGGKLSDKPTIVIGSDGITAHGN